MENKQINKLKDFLGDLDNLVTEHKIKENESYICPAFTNAGSVAIVRVIETVGPMIFRNQEQNITDVSLNDGLNYICGKPNKTKYADKRLSLQISRLMNAGGNYPQNRHYSASHDAFDLTSLTFGDSVFANGNDVLSLRSCVAYSDILGLMPYSETTDESFHISCNEMGTNYDFKEKKTSSSVFSRYFIKPGTLMVQVLTLNGRRLPPELFDHLLLCIGAGGTYGGQTSITGTNARNHIVGIFASKLENPNSSPYEIHRLLKEKNIDMNNLEEVTLGIHEIFKSNSLVSVTSKESSNHIRNLQEKFENDDLELREQYALVHQKITEMIDVYFLNEKKTSKGKKGK